MNNRIKKDVILISWLFFVSFLLIPAALLAQEEYTGLSIGDTLPQTNQYAFFAGKPVILDFWATSCSSCIAAFPELEALQKKFQHEMKIVLVNTESAEKIKSNFAKFKKKISLPPNLASITSDTILSRLFPYRMVPQHVWIDSRGVVKAITSGYNATAENIGKLINGYALNLEVRKDIMDFDRSRKWSPLWMEGNGRHIPHLQYFSYIMNRIPGIGAGSGFFRDSASGAITGLHVFNGTIPALLKMTIRKKYLFFDDNRIVYEVADSLRYYFSNSRDIKYLDQWRDEHLYCYELRVPAADSGRLYQIMLQDLERFFGVTARLENRKTSCLVLVRNRDLSHLKTSGNQPAVADFKADSVRLVNKSLSNFVYALNHNTSNQLPVIDETGFPDKIDLKLDVGLQDIAKLKQALLRHGLDLINTHRQLEMLVIKPIQNKLQ